MINPVVFIGKPLYFEEKFTIHVPTVTEVIANPKFGQYKKILTFSQEELEYELREHLKDHPEQKVPTPLEFLLANSYHNKMYNWLVLESFEYFVGAIPEIDIENKQLKFNFDEVRILNEDNFFDFQNKIREACGDSPVKKPEVDDPNEDPRIKRIKQKARERDILKARKGVSGGISFDIILVAICCMGIGVTPLNIGEMSYASIPVIMKVCQEKEKYDLDVKSLLAGADSKKIKPKYWIRNYD